MRASAVAARSATGDVGVDAADLAEEGPGAFAVLGPGALREPQAALGEQRGERLVRGEVVGLDDVREVAAEARGDRQVAVAEHAAEPVRDDAAERRRAVVLEVLEVGGDGVGRFAVVGELARVVELAALLDLVERSGRDRRPVAVEDRAVARGVEAPRRRPGSRRAGRRR